MPITLHVIPELEKLNRLSIRVVDANTEAQARAHLTEVDTARKHLLADIRALKTPHQLAIKEIDEAANPWKALLSSVEDRLSQAILAYTNKLRAAVAKANDKARDRFEAKSDRLEEQALAEGKPMPIVAQPVMKPEPAKTVVAGGKQQITVRRKAWRLPLAAAWPHDPAMLTALTAQAKGLSIPMDFFVLDTVRIGKLVRAGESIPGIDVYEEESITIR